MSSDFFRRFILNTPEIFQDQEMYGTLTLPTMSSILGANPNTITNPADAYAAQNRLVDASRFGFISTGTQSNLFTGTFSTLPSFSMPSWQNFARGTGRFIKNLAGAVADLTILPGTSRGIDWIAAKSGYDNLTRHRYTMDTPSPYSNEHLSSPFLPEYLGGSGEAYSDVLGFYGPGKPENEGSPYTLADGSTYNPVTGERFASSGARMTHMGTYRSGRGFATGSVSPRDMGGAFTAAGVTPDSAQYKQMLDWVDKQRK